MLLLVCTKRRVAIEFVFGKWFCNLEVRKLSIMRRRKNILRCSNSINIYFFNTILNNILHQNYPILHFQLGYFQFALICFIIIQYLERNFGNQMNFELFQCLGH